MTGTGTKTDPYIVSDWEEIKTALTENNAYIKCEPNLMIDWNNIDPNGQLEQINVKCAEFDGNGLIISGLFRDLNNKSFIYVSSGVLLIKNLQIINFQINTGFLFGAYQSASYEFYNCILDGDLIDGNISSNGALKFHYSYLKFNTYGSSKLPSPLCLDHAICSVNQKSQVTGTAATSLYCNDFILKGSYGYKIELYRTQTKRGIIDLSLISDNVGKPIVNGDCAESLVVINTDKIDLDNNVKIIRATTAQLRDPVALKALGFPIRSVQNE